LSPISARNITPKVVRKTRQSISVSLISRGYEIALRKIYACGNFMA
jgi:hypothetical protein